MSGVKFASIADIPVTVQFQKVSEQIMSYLATFIHFGDSNPVSTQLASPN